MYSHCSDCKWGFFAVLLLSLLNDAVPLSSDVNIVIGQPIDWQHASCSVTCTLQAFAQTALLHSMLQALASSICDIVGT